MENNGISPDVYFKKFHLPVSEPDDPHALIPEKPFWQLINQVSIAEMIPDFGMQVAQARPWYEVETLKPLLAGRQPLGKVLELFCSAAGNQSNTSGFKLSFENDLCWFESHGEVLIKNDIQMENYRITSMIELVQLAAGRNWKPLVVRLMMDDNKVIHKNKLLEDCDLIFSQSRTAISLPVGLLHANVSVNPGTIKTTALDSIHDKSDFLAALKAIISQYIHEHDLSIEMIAEICGCTTRKLQRLLKEYEISYTEILNEARMNYAMTNLEYSNLTITEIAYKLGYNDAAHFTRAFKRWTGMTPSQYRKQKAN
jgi:AraC-like DNA-binding protein